MAGWACGCATRPGRRSLAPRRCIRRDGAGGLTAPKSAARPYDAAASSASCPCGPERAAPRPSREGDPAGGGPGPQRRPATLFRRPEPGPLQREAKEPPGAVLRCAAALTGHPMRQVAWGPLGAGPPRLRLSVATKAAAVAASRTQEPPMLDDLLSPLVPADTDDDAGQAPSPAVHPLDELALYGCRPFQDDADPRPLPEPHAAEGAIAGALNALADLFCGTRLEDDLPDLLWSFVNLFHRKADRITRDLDDNEQAQRRSQAEQDGSEVKSVDLERLIAQGLTLTERRNAFEFLRDHAAEHYAAHTGSAWRPRSGSMVNHRTLTAAVIDSRDFLNAKRRAETEVLLPPGPTRSAHRLRGRDRLQRPRPDLGGPRPGAREAPGDGP